MTEQYLSENIVIKEGSTFYQDKLIKKHNWHLKLEELGWDKLSKQWITKLNKYHNPYPNNSLFADPYNSPSLNLTNGGFILFALSLVSEAYSG